MSYHSRTVTTGLIGMHFSPAPIGKIARDKRKKLGISQKHLALTSGTGLRFISDLENGKPTCQLNKVLDVLYTLGIRLESKI